MTMTFGSSVIVMLLGMLIVFSGLVILIAAVIILSAALRGVEKRKEAPQAAVAAPAPVEAAPAPVVEAGVSPEIVAVIAAAIAACEGSGKRLIVRSVRRLGGAWGSAARSANMNY